VPRVSVIIPIFNGSRYLSAFFETLKQALPSDTQLILIDDGSTEPVFEAVPALPNASEVIRIRNDHNQGYSVAVNQGFSRSSGDYIVQLNTDLILDPDCIIEMVNLINTKNGVGIVGSKLLFPTTELIQHIGMTFGYHSKKHVYFQLPADHPLCCKTRPMQIMTGATVAMTRQLLDKIGPLDERYFNYNEDIDHCLKAATRGYTNYTCADSIAYHWVSQSGPARFGKIKESEAIFWSNWGSKYDIDLSTFIDEAVHHLIDYDENLLGLDFDIINLCRSNDEKIAISVLEQYWPGIASRVYHYRQFNIPGEMIWLTMALPYWLQENPKPFIYIVDRHQYLSENRLWFRNRMRLVNEEIVVDLTGCAIPLTEFLSILSA
jgi:GT2 family glycosyltransferase